jgi:hypothetical protein
MDIPGVYMSALGATADTRRAVILGAILLAVSSWSFVATPRATATETQVRITEPVAAEAPLQVDKTTVRSRYIAVTIDQLPGAGPVAPSQATAPNTPIALELFQDVSIVAIFDRFDPNPRGITWVGHVSGVEGSTVTLIYGDGLLTGNVLTPAATYTIRPAPAALRGATRLAAGQLHVAAQIDLTA